MRKGGGKQKGAVFEREVCVLLSNWLSGGTQDDIFWRSAMSGGRATVAFKKGGKRLANQAGDITCIHPTGNRFISAFAAECKFYASLDFQGLITGKGKLVTFWDEINKQAERYAKYPFLIARQNRVPALICLTHSGCTTLSVDVSKTILISRPLDLYIFELERFFQLCTPFV